MNSISVYCESEDSALTGLFLSTYAITLIYRRRLTDSVCPMLGESVACNDGILVAQHPLIVAGVQQRRRRYALPGTHEGAPEIA
jgi:hypothetical protein